MAAFHSAEARYCSSGAVSDCNSVLVVYAADPSRGVDVQTKLLSTGAFLHVNTFDARWGTPTEQQLDKYDAVLIFSGPTFGDAVLLGDRLAAYHDRGGGVIVCALANAGLSRLKGAYGEAANGYALLNYAAGIISELPGSLGLVLDPTSPLLNGVDSFAASTAYRSTAPVITGRGVVVARWRSAGEEPLVVRGERNGRTLVELNIYPPSSSEDSRFWAGSGAALLRNALKFLRCKQCIPGTFSGEEQSKMLFHNAGKKCE